MRYCSGRDLLAVQWRNHEDPSTASSGSRRKNLVVNHGPADKVLAQYNCVKTANPNAVINTAAHLVELILLQRLEVSTVALMLKLCSSSRVLLLLVIASVVSKHEVYNVGTNLRFPTSPIARNLRLRTCRLQKPVTFSALVVSGA